MPVMIPMCYMYMEEDSFYKDVRLGVVDECLVRHLRIRIRIKSHQVFIDLVVRAS